jgi:hypothetical protein
MKRWYYCNSYRLEPKERQTDVEELDEKTTMLRPMVQVEENPSQ